MNFQPILACGGGPLILLIVLAPALNCAVVFTAGAICFKMGNTNLGGWLMALSGFFGAFSFMAATTAL